VWQATLQVPSRVFPRDPVIEQAVLACEQAFERIGCATSSSLRGAILVLPTAKGEHLVIIIGLAAPVSGWPTRLWTWPVGHGGVERIKRSIKDCPKNASTATAWIPCWVEKVDPIVS
jgi:hypothetical protein